MYNIKSTYKNQQIIQKWNQEKNAIYNSTIASKTRNNLAISFTKEIQNHIWKVLFKEIKNDLSKWKHIPCSKVRRLIKLTYSFNVSSIKIPPRFFVFFFCLNWHAIPIIHMEMQKTKKSQNNIFLKFGGYKWVLIIEK